MMNSKFSTDTRPTGVNKDRSMSPSPCIYQPPLPHATQPTFHSLSLGCALPSILIVDDAAEFRRTLREGLVIFGYDCQEAECGTDALRYLKNRKFDVVLTDLVMPFLDGLGLAQHIMEDRSYGHPLVILMTSGHSDMVKSLAKTFGIKNILDKPCKASEINRIIREEPLRFPKAA
ncbi:response regulator [Candidatus Nitronereus thalassa]|uniref:Response regulator n=1 Tax=Candidatus Nitronereus thalassa TaxID=3020898 RepID=A0ABU3K5S5_9BACT|nr:response regulator [Candidatus Nitronereus thalassa]MDT7041728.1 response regulator [Candidatus Nitronereus thalassa]